MRWWQWIDRLLNPKRMSYPMITAAALWLAWTVSIAFGLGNFDFANNVVGTDYLQFYSAGLILRSGESERLFDLNYQKQVEESIVGAPLPAVHAFITPPAHALLYVPLSRLPYLASFILWSLIGFVCLWLSLAWLGLDEPARRFIWALTWFPVFASISFGQNSLLSLAILGATYFLWCKDRRFVAGLVSSLLFYKPQLLLGVGLLWLLEWRRNWITLLGLLAGACFQTALSIWLFPQATRDFLFLARTFLPHMQSLPGFPIWHSHTLRAFWLLLFPGQTGLAEILALIISLIGIYAFIRFWQQYSGNQPLLYAAAIGLTVLITPHSMIYDWVLLLIPAVLLWEWLPGLHSQWKAAFALMWVTVITSGSLAYLQYQWLGRALQISVPVFIFILINAYLELIKVQGIYTPNSNPP